ncbi:ABC transporter ATP-binding protein [Sporolactobacillus sp. THM19-2]|uniref:ABC transporter ATP-binding protein n=1 Tax=Sporolactobacillus sp. THM19-2 TaxID=2511171 RepID=UPI00101F1E92|nr:ABC transporter ATP-binding protein [Sporolactobacillus sp. THM19-2]RYL94474.1 ABC transporter ATP-binding protein [Sporolactobacillus sp. THM19-2]
MAKSSIANVKNVNEENGADIAIKARQINVVYSTPTGDIPAVRNVDLDLPKGSITGIIGESGSGKSTLIMAIMNAVTKPGKILSGSVILNGRVDMLKLSTEQQRNIRGNEIGFVFQAAQNSLNPLRRVGQQILDLGRSHDVKDLRGLIKYAKELLTRLGLDADRVLASYQHELSGGMRQRVGIMFALVLKADIVFLDESTTALDMLSQASVLEIIRELQKEKHLTIALVSHDIGVVADLSERIEIFYAGEIVEEGETRKILADPQHPYTRGLIRAIPRISGNIDAAEPLKGSPPDFKTYQQPGCLFYDRCPIRTDSCLKERPKLVNIEDSHKVACFRVGVHDRD